jgi:integrase
MRRAGRERLREFAEEWWELYARPNLADSTLKLYSVLLSRHALPRLGGYRLRDLTPSVISRFRSDLERDGVGPEAVRKTMSILQGILQRAVEWDRISSNPARVARKPRSTRKRAVRPLPPAMVERLRRLLMQENRYADAVLVCTLAYAGLRPGEALALSWWHVRKRTLLVERALSDGQFKGQKNERSPRAVDLLRPLAEDLVRLRKLNGEVDAASLVFPAASGEPWRDHDWRNWRKRVFKPAATACGATGVRPYDLRHSFVSLLIHEGRLSTVEIAEQLGHSPATCLSRYAHVFAELRGAEKVSAQEQIYAARACAHGRLHVEP